MTLSLKVIDRNDNTICVSNGGDFVDLDCIHMKKGTELS